MKIETLDEKYLKGIINGKIVDWDINNCSINSDYKLDYTLQFGVLTSHSGESPTVNSVKVTFTWITEGERVETGDEEFPYENKQEPHESWFILIRGEKISKLHSYVEDVLEEVTG